MTSHAAIHIPQQPQSPHTPNNSTPTHFASYLSNKWDYLNNSLLLLWGGPHNAPLLISLSKDITTLLDFFHSTDGLSFPPFFLYRLQPLFVLFPHWSNHTNQSLISLSPIIQLNSYPCPFVASASPISLFILENFLLFIPRELFRSYPQPVINYYHWRSLNWPQHLTMRMSWFLDVKSSAFWNNVWIYSQIWWSQLEMRKDWMSNCFSSTPLSEFWGIPDW